jgi:uncharacterized membrane protein YcaP (DUF421 family)
MDSVIRAIVIYIVFLVYFRISGKRSFSQATIFDFVLLLIIAEVTDGALTGTTPLTNALLVITTLITVDILFSFIKRKFKNIERAVDSIPLLIVENGKLLKDRIKKERVDKEDILESARKTRGIENLGQIKYAILEKDGHISIIPFERDKH